MNDDDRCGDNFWLYLPKEYDYEEPQRCCSKCFKEKSNIDHTRKYDVYGPEEGIVRSFTLLW